ncbi:hypothetical protein PybrP1_008553 [[Pythium] brassicae (nom. inval.)]|nr:hypothetical protein PybrP1_008553 [[Pythium] brassicae (nom. inval.)]
MEFPPLARASADDDLYFMDELLLLKNESSAAAVAAAHAHSMDVDALLMGFDFDEHAAFALEHAQLSLLPPVTPTASATAPGGSADAFSHRSAAGSFDGSASPTTSEDMSGSEMSSPAPSFNASPASSPVRLAPRTTPAVNSSSATASGALRMAPSALNALAATSSLPYALPVAYFPSQSVLALNMNQKRPLQPEAPLNAAASSSLSASLEGAAGDAKKSKREIRQMKNRESANKSRLRRKAQMSELSDEVGELTKKQHELENTIAALRAENKSLHDQNAFLRSLVAKPLSSAELLAGQQQQPLLPPPPFVATAGPVLADGNALCAMESGQEPAFVPQKKAKTSRATTFSAASLSLCASVFGVTIFSDYDGGSAQSSHIRRPGRVLHSLPASVADPGFSPAPWSSALDFTWQSLASLWMRMSTSELAFGVFLNVLSFVVIMSLYHLWEASLAAPSYRVHKWAAADNSKGSGARSLARPARPDAKRRSGSWHLDSSAAGGKTLLNRVRELL